MHTERSRQILHPTQDRPLAAKRTVGKRLDCHRMGELVFFIGRQKRKILGQTDQLGAPSLCSLAERLDLSKVTLHIGCRAKLNHCGF